MWDYKYLINILKIKQTMKTILTLSDILNSCLRFPAQVCLRYENSHFSKVVGRRSRIDAICWASVYFKAPPSAGNTTVSVRYWTGLSRARFNEIGRKREQTVLLHCTSYSNIARTTMWFWQYPAVVALTTSAAVAVSQISCVPNQPTWTRVKHHGCQCNGFNVFFIFQLVSAYSGNDGERRGWICRLVLPEEMVRHAYRRTCGVVSRFLCSSASNRIIHAKDHASIQLSIADVDPVTGRMTDTSKIYALCGAIRRMGESDYCIVRLATKDGILAK